MEHLPIYSQLLALLKRYQFSLVGTLILSVALIVSGGVLAEKAFAATKLVVPEKLNQKVTKDLGSWAHIRSNKATAPVLITKGVRKDTEKVTRVIENRVTGSARNLKLDIAKEISLNYEVYTSGSNKGKIYRVYKPTIKHTAKNAQYLGLLKITVKPSVTVSSYGINAKGEAVVVLAEQTTFTLPRQFPLKQSSFIELLRQSFKIQSTSVTRTFTIAPSGTYGKLSLSLSE